jgi:hypothetical protein
MEKKVRKVLTVETVIPGVNNFVRVQVKFDVRKVLARFVTVVREGHREFFQLKYEKFPKFCGACGFPGHSHLECGSGEHNEDDLKWRDWLKADWSTWHGRGTQTIRGGGRPSHGREASGMGRGRGFGGRGEPPVSWRFNALPVSRGDERTEEELQDIGTSPIKRTQMDLDGTDPSSDSGSKRRLDMEENPDAQKENIDGMSLAMITNGNIQEEDNLDLEIDRTKQTKKAGADPLHMNRRAPSRGLAGSNVDPQFELSGIG